MDTIAALSTAPAMSGVGVIRISGERALAVLTAVFKSKTALYPRQMVLGNLVNTDGIIIDCCMAVYFAAPASFTGEDVCELHCHGSLAVLNSALNLCMSAGARPARAGEFTKRAFLNGKLDLLQAEAVGELIAAETEDAAKNAAAMLGGALGRALSDIYEKLMDMLARFRAVADYPEEDIEPEEIPEMLAVLGEARAKLSEIQRRSERGKLFREGINCAIIGRPNAGKSSLLNALAGETRAIVTEIPGTTRDIVEQRVSLGGLTLRLRDTAGLRDTADEIEKIGVTLALAAAETAELVLAVFDGGAPLSAEDFTVISAAKAAKNVVWALNKSDLETEKTLVALAVHGITPILISTKSGAGLDLLESEIRRFFDAGDLRFDGTLMTSARQEAACKAAIESLAAGEAALASGAAADMALFDVESACDKLAELFGKTVGEDIIDRVFANFCVGK